MYKSIFLTALITTSTIIFINTVLGTLILALTAGYWVLKVIGQVRRNKKENA